MMLVHRAQVNTSQINKGGQERRMVQTLTALAMITILLPLAQAHATLPAPVCRLPTVVDVMARTLRLNPHYTRLNPRLISETPTLDPTLVQCDVCVNVIMYDAVRFGAWPVARCEPRTFTVQALRNGFVVRPLR
jgi:hypothetical protein